MCVSSPNILVNTVSKSAYPAPQHALVDFSNGGGLVARPTCVPVPSLVTIPPGCDVTAPIGGDQPSTAEVSPISCGDHVF